MQYEQFSDKAKQIIELVKSCKYIEEKDNNPYWYEYNSRMIEHVCLLFNIPKEYSNIINFCHSKNYWKNSK